MGTPETSVNMATSREARNAILIAMIFLVLDLAGMAGVISPAFSGQTISTLNIMEMTAIAGMIALVLLAIRKIRRGQVESGVLYLIYSLAITATFGVLARESTGVSIGVVTALMISATGFLALPRRAGFITILGYGLGGVIVLIDLYASSFYSRPPAPPSLVIVARSAAVAVFLTHAIVLITVSRTLKFASKVGSYFAVFTLLAVIIVGSAGIQALSNQIASGTDVTGFARLTLKILERWTILTGVFVSFFGAVIGVIIARAITNPLSHLAIATGKVASGDLEARAVVNTKDEVADLANSFNIMADSLKGLVGQLEIRVQDRTRDLQRRSVEIQTAVEIGRIVTSMRDLENLLKRTTQLITDRFGFYHSGIFLVDQAHEYAILQAASSEGGSRMLERGHRLKVGETGIVGFVTQTGQARIALDVGQDAVFFDNPHLPDTRSEMALPLIAGGIVLGALDVQSTEAQAFDEQDIGTLQILADQLAIAIENARLFGETQDALEATRVAYGDMSRQAWAKIIKTQPRLSYVAEQTGGIQQNNNPPGMDVLRTLESGDMVTSGDGRTIAIPVKVRGQSIGALKLRKQDTSSAWTQDETALAIALSEQLSGALDSARLYKESQQRAARETLVSDISARITALPRVDTILRETVQELGHAIGDAAITFQLLEMPNERAQAQGGVRSESKAPGNGSGAGPDFPNNSKDKE